MDSNTQYHAEQARKNNRLALIIVGIAFVLIFICPITFIIVGSVIDNRMDKKENDVEIKDSRLSPPVLNDYEESYFKDKFPQDIPLHEDLSRPTTFVYDDKDQSFKAVFKLKEESDPVEIFSFYDKHFYVNYNWEWFSKPGEYTSYKKDGRSIRIEYSSSNKTITIRQDFEK